MHLYDPDDPLRLILDLETDDEDLDDLQDEYDNDGEEDDVYEEDDMEIYNVSLLASSLPLRTVAELPRSAFRSIAVSDGSAGGGLQRSRLTDSNFDEEEDRNRSASRSSDMQLFATAATAALPAAVVVAAATAVALSLIPMVLVT